MLVCSSGNRPLECYFERKFLVLSFLTHYSHYTAELCTMYMYSVMYTLYLATMVICYTAMV